MLVFKRISLPLDLVHYVNNSVINNIKITQFQTQVGRINKSSLSNRCNVFSSSVIYQANLKTQTKKKNRMIHKKTERIWHKMRYVTMFWTKKICSDPGDMYVARTYVRRILLLICNWNVSWPRSAEQCSSRSMWMRHAHDHDAAKASRHLSRSLMTK